MIQRIAFVLAFVAPLSQVVLDSTIPRLDLTLGEISNRVEQGLTKCPKCGRAVEKTWKFCDRCGAKLEASSSGGGNTGGGTGGSPSLFDGHPDVRETSGGGSVPVAKQVSTGSYLTRGIAVSRNGDAFYFGSNRGTTTDIYTCRADGSNMRPLTTGVDAEFDPDVSPDGSQITYVAEDNRGESAIMVLPSNGSGSAETVIRLKGVIQHPRWSPNGKQIAFVSNHQGNDEVYVVNVDGMNLARITDSSANDGYPAWCPLGCHLAFHSDRLGRYQIWAVHLRSGTPVQITKTADACHRPSWGAGHRIAFETNADGNFEVYTLNEAGRDMRRMTSFARTDGMARFSGDGKKLAFVRVVSSSEQEIFVVTVP